MAITIRAAVFSVGGNRFLLSGYWHVEGDENWKGRSMLDLTWDGMMTAIALGCEDPHEWLDLEVNSNEEVDLINVPATLSGPQFAEGGTEVLLISGPLFDAAQQTLSAQPNK
jgi:hypothetical protein